MTHTDIFKSKSVQLDSETEKKAEIRPLTKTQIALAFGLPALMMLISFHWFMPWLQSIGLTPFESMIVAHTVPMALLLTAVLVMYHRVDGFALNWQAFSQRMRYPRLTFKAVLQGVGLFLFINLAYGLFAAIGQVLIVAGWVSVPANLPALLDPQMTLTTAAIENMVGENILGNWRVVVLYAIMLFFNIVAEELWWRGYILPRQEAAHGRFAWVWNGLLWAVFHLFKWWDLIGLLPVCLALAFVSQRTKDNWPAFIAHLLFNGMAFVIVITAVVITIG